MKIYFLVEGRRTEKKVYTAWLKHLLPELNRMTYCDDAVTDGYFLISGEGYPSLIYDHLPAAIADINRVGGYNYLAVSLDADEDSVIARHEEINSFVAQQGSPLRNAKLIVIVQNRCIETWFLGNRRIVTRNPQSQILCDYLAYYDVRQQDPEMMGCHSSYLTHSQFHLHYLKELLQAKSLSYTKNRPGHVLEQSYLAELQARVHDQPTDLASLQVFLNFCQEIKFGMNNSLSV